MKRINIVCDPRKNRKGAIAAMTAFLLLAIIGLIACALDIGWIEMTRTQLQAGADASSLAAGTELMPGLGYLKTKTPDEVAADATPIAVEFAGYNRNGERPEVVGEVGTYVDGGRDVEFGKATFEPVEQDDGSVGCGCWKKTPASENPAYYNYVAVKVLRNQVGSTAGDGPLPLFFAKIFGINEKSLLAGATAAILPVNGFQVTEGSEDTADVMPLAFNKKLWDRFENAQEYFDSHPGVLSDPNLDDVLDQNGSNPTEPLFGSYNDLNGNGTYDGGNEFVQLFFDSFTRSNGGAVSSGADTHLEVSIYSGKLPANGNWGTVDFGSSSNSSSEVNRQISEGLNADDLSYYDNNELVLDPDDPLSTGGDTGEYSPFKAPLEAVKGKCKAIALFESATGSGNNAIFVLSKFVGATVVQVNLTGNPTNRVVRVQPCVLIDDNGIPDPEDDDLDDNTIFTPLILIR